MDIGKKNIHIVEGSNQKGIVVIDKAVAVAVPEGSFNGEMIQNAEMLRECLEKAIQHNNFGTKDTVVTFNGFGSIIRDIDLPAAKPKEIDAMIKTEMTQTYNVSSEQVIQYRSIEKLQSENGAMLDKYRTAAIDKAIVQSYHDLITSAKLKPVAMDININSISKLLEGDFTINDTMISANSTMFIDFGDILTTVYIVSKGKPIFFRQLDSGCGDIEKNISEQVFEPLEQIRKMKEDGYNFFGETEEEQKYFSILRPFFYTIIDEIRKIIGFYASRTNAGSIDNLFLFGGGSNLKGFAEYCESNFGIPTEQVTKLSKIKLTGTSIPIASYLNAAGSLIRY